MTQEPPSNPLHGITLETVVTDLVEHFGWEALAQRIDINRVTSDPSIKWPLRFSRKTPWAWDNVERL
jgi:uncharacterized protein (DUF2132 family)